MMRIFQKTSSVSGDDSTSSHHQVIATSKICHALYPVVFLMKLTGLSFTKAAIYVQRRVSVTPSQVFATFLLVLHWVNFLRSLLMIDGHETFSSETFFKIVFLTLGISVVTNMTSMYVGSLKERSQWY